VAEDLAEALPVAPAAAPSAPRRRPAFRLRFLIAYLVLGVLGGVGIAAGFVLLTGAERAVGTSWASWEPIGSQSTYGQQIADHVALRYRLPSGDQMVGVVPGPPEVSGVKVTAVAIQDVNATSSEDIHVQRADDSFMYLLCGLGESCAIDKGEPSEERHRLLRREALELAFYTFKYVDDVDSVITMLPPGAPGQNATALFLEKKHFEQQLSRPLAETLEDPDAKHVMAVPELETVTIDRLTRPFLYEYEFQPLQNASAVLILVPPTPAE
jgi:hypothetical protein